MTKNFSSMLGVFLFCAGANSIVPAIAETIVSVGVLGNSGEQGKSLVRFAPASASGLGVAVDRFGSLWDRAGLGNLNRYALDGRLIAQYRIPNGFGAWHQNEQITIVGDTVVLLLGGQIYTLPVTATPDTQPLELKVVAQRISFGSSNGMVAAWNNGELSTVDVATGKTKKIGAIKDVNWLDMGSDGAVYAIGGDWQIHKFVNGKEITEGWPRRTPGERAQLLDGYWWGQSWGSTIRRFNVSGQPDPGVVLGGYDGSFLGYLESYQEINNGRGMAKIRNGLYAVSGFEGITSILKWQPEVRQMAVVRRIGSVPNCRGLGLDRAGNVWWFAGAWKWSDGPTAPIRYGTPTAEGPGIGQTVMLPNDNMVAPHFALGKPSLYFGPIRGASQQRLEQSAMQRNTAGSAVYRNAQSQLVLLTITSAGQGQSIQIADDGRYIADVGPVTLQTSTPVKEWTSLAMKNENTLLGAGDGAVIELARDGNNWKESRRWSSWNGKEKPQFGSKIFITSDSNRLWIADREEHRVLSFDLATNALLASFGNQKGADLKSFDAPETIAARGDRAVIYDSGNQRLMKLYIIG